MNDISRSLPTGWRMWVAGARVRTLPAAIVPVLVGTAAVAHVNFELWRALTAGVVSLALQIATNYANDYSDGVRGTDDQRVGPLRLVGSGAATPAAVKRAMLVSFAVAAVSGMVLVVLVNPWLLLVGFAAMAAGWFYTGGSHPYGYVGLGELSVFVFFGLVATIGSAFIQIEAWSWFTAVLAVPVGVFATALLMVNNLRDRVGDAAAGKLTLAVRVGDRLTRIGYVASILAAFLVIAIAAVVAERGWALLGLIGLLPALPALRSVAQGAKGRSLIPVLEATARTQLLAGAALALGLTF